MVIAGIDVGGVKKGFHVSVLDSDIGFVDLHNFHSTEGISDYLRGFDSLKLIAIDCPPRAQINGPRTRLAERQINQAGFKVQWTRRLPLEPDEWMLNGEKLWKSLEKFSPQVQLIETFPTIVSRELGDCELVLPLKLLRGGQVERAGYKDFIDSCLSAWAGMRFLRGEARGFGQDGEEVDELGIIWC